MVFNNDIFKHDGKGNKGDNCRKSTIFVNIKINAQISYTINESISLYYYYYSNVLYN